MFYWCILYYTCVTRPQWVLTGCKRQVEPSLARSMHPCRERALYRFIHYLREWSYIPSNLMIFSSSMWSREVAMGVDLEKTWLKVTTLTDTLLGDIMDAGETASTGVPVDWTLRDIPVQYSSMVLYYILYQTLWLLLNSEDRTEVVFVYGMRACFMSSGLKTIADHTCYVSCTCTSRVWGFTLMKVLQLMTSFG